MIFRFVRFTPVCRFSIVPALPFGSTCNKDPVVARLLSLALSEMILKGKGAWRVHGGGFGGTIQAFVPKDLLDKYVETLEHVYGKGKCHKLFIRAKGSIKLDL